MEQNNEQKERQVENLVNLVEKHTRTERHLEQYSHIGAPEYKDMAREKQEKRAVDQAAGRGLAGRGRELRERMAARKGTAGI